MEALVGYVIGALTFITGVFTTLTTLLRGVDSVLLKARATIKDEFTFAYRDFGNTVAAEGVKSEKLGMCVKRLRCLHYTSYFDLLKLRLIEWLLGKTPLFWISIVVLVIISLVLGRTVFNESEGSKRVIFLIIIPLILFVAQFFLSVWIFKREGYLNRVIERYKNVEYMQ